MSVKELIINEVDRLPENVLVEVYDFIQFLEVKKERNLLAMASQELSVPSFQKIWDNEEDAADEGARSRRRRPNLSLLRRNVRAKPKEDRAASRRGVRPVSYTHLRAHETRH